MTAGSYIRVWSLENIFLSFRLREKDIYMKFAKEKYSKLKDTFKEKREKIKEMSALNKIFYIGIIAVAAVLIGGLIHQSLAYQNFEIISSIEKTDNVTVNYQVMGDGLLRYSKDGVSYSENLSETVWNQSFEMASARAVTCGNYLAIGDIGSNQIRIFDQTGQVGSIVTSYPILDLDVASQGVVSVIMTENGANYISLYSSNGEELVDIRTSISDMGYPLDFALSEDGEKLAVSYLNVAEGTTSTNIVFYNFGTAGANEVDHIMGTFDYDGIFPKIEFLDNSTIAAYGEENFVLYSMHYYPELISETNFGREIKSLFVSDKYIGFVFRNNTETSEEESPAKYHMAVYTTAGRLYMEQDFDFEYETITSTNQEIILYNDSECVIYTYSGKEKFSYTFNEPVINLLPKNTADEYILITSSAIQEIRLR